MAEMLSWATDIDSPEEMEQVGKTIGGELRGGEIIQLAGDIGSGKTTLVRGLARGIGSNDHVSSPTFTFGNLYKGPAVSVHHLDFYRLPVDEDGAPSRAIMEHTLEEAIDDQDQVVVIEWGDVVRETLKKVDSDKRLEISFAANNVDSRHLRFHYPKTLAYLVESLLQ